MYSRTVFSCRLVRNLSHLRYSIAAIVSVLALVVTLPSQANIEYRWARATKNFYAGNHYAIFDCENRGKNIQSGNESGGGISPLCAPPGNGFHVGRETGRLYANNTFNVVRCENGYTNAIGEGPEGIAKMCFPNQWLSPQRGWVVRGMRTGRMYHNSKFFHITRCNSPFVNLQSGTNEGISPYCVNVNLPKPLYAIPRSPPKSATPKGALAILGSKLADLAAAPDLKKLLVQLDEAHRHFKDILPIYGAIERESSEFVRKIGGEACALGFEAVVKPVIAMCSNYERRATDLEIIETANNALIKKGFFAKEEFSGVTFRWCNLPNDTHTMGMVPDRDLVYIDIEKKNKSVKELAALIGHEMEHVRQYRRLGSTKFKCYYGQKYAECRCQDEGHPLEKSAYQMEDFINRYWHSY